MSITEESEAKEYIEDLCHEKRCVSCQRARKRNRKVLCRSCEKIWKDCETLENLVQREPGEARDTLSELRLRIAREKKKECISWGDKLRSILHDPVDGGNLEGWLRLAAEQIANDKSMYFAISGFLNGIFTTEQQRVLSYLFWEMFSAHASRNRERQALANISRQKSGE
jgi:hypothetical protein